ncbi:MAG: IS630 family transposase [Cyanobacteria bacterium J06629_18]
MRLTPKGAPDPELYQVRKEALGLIEAQSEQGHIDLFYGDETKVSQEGYVPYGWQFEEEQIAIEASKGRSINCFGLLSRSNQFFYRNREANINAEFIIETLDAFSLSIQKPTVVVLDNARVHTARKVKELFDIWQNRGLYIFYLPPYSPHLNIIERLWKEFKEGWIKPSDYQSPDDLFYAVDRICASIGKNLFVNFAKYKR